MFHYAPGRGAVHALRFLKGYRGQFVQCDGYEAYDKLTKVDRAEGPWTLVHCWTHARRRFVKRLEKDGSPIAEEALRQIAELYAIEKHPSAAHAPDSASPHDRTSPRRSSPPSNPGSRHNSRAFPDPRNWRKTSATRSARWPGLTRFLEDGRLELDTNPVENQIRKIALTRKNALFAGHEVGAENWAMLASLIANCKMSDVDPVSYLADTLRALLDGHPKSRIDELMPWNFTNASSRAEYGIGEALTIILGEIVLIHDLKRQGLSVSAIARKLGMDRKTVRKHLEVGIASPAYSPRAAQPRLIAPYEDYLRARITAWPDLSGKRLLRELKERGYSGCYSVVTDFLRDARPPRAQVFERRFETAAGKQAQVDFAQFRVEFTDEPGVVRILWLFTIILGPQPLALGPVLRDPGFADRPALPHRRLRRHGRRAIRVALRPDEDGGDRRGRQWRRPVQHLARRAAQPLRRRSARLPAVPGQDDR